MFLATLLYIGEQSPRFKTQINIADLNYRYHLINIKDLDCTALLQSDSLSDNLLALLGKLQDKAAAFQRVMNKIAMLPQNKRADMLEKLTILVGLRPKELPLLLEKEKYMSISIDLEQNPIFVEIFNRYTQRGEQRGEQRGIQIGRTTWGTTRKEIPTTKTIGETIWRITFMGRESFRASNFPTVRTLESANLRRTTLRRFV